MVYIDIERLKTLFKYNQTTSCGETQDFICGALTNNWDKNICKYRKTQDYYNPNWSSIDFISENKHYIIESVLSHNQHHFIDNKVTINVSIDTIMMLVNYFLDLRGYICISLDFNYIDEDIQTLYPSDHALTLCNTIDGIIIIDSYVGVRQVSIRPYDNSLLEQLLSRRSIADYNNFCECSHNGNYEKIELFFKLNFITQEKIVIKDGNIIVDGCVF